jgi:hypothetical protein
MKKIFISCACGILLFAGIFAAGIWTNSEAAQFDPNTMFPGKSVNTLDKQNGSLLINVSDPIPADSSPDYLSGLLYQVDASSKAVLVDKNVVSAKFLSNGDILYSARGSLLRWNGEAETIISGVESDFAVSPDEKRITTVSYNFNEDSSEIFSIDFSGLNKLKLADGVGRIFWPVYSPDGRWLLFVAAFTGVSSWYRVDLNNPSVAVQITNRGLRPGPDVLSDAFIPIPQMLESLEFIDEQTIEYETGNGRIRLNFVDGKKQ